MHLLVNLRPKLLWHTVQHRTERHRHRPRLLPYFLRRSRPAPRYRLRLFLHFAKPRRAHLLRQASRRAKAKRIRSSRRQQWSAHVPVHYAHHALPVGLVERSPGHKTRPGVWTQHAPQFAERALDIAEKHHAESRGRQIKAVLGKRQLMRVTLLNGKILQIALLRATLRNLKKFRAKIERRYMSSRPHSHS